MSEKEQYWNKIWSDLYSNNVTLTFMRWINWRGKTDASRQVGGYHNSSVRDHSSWELSGSSKSYEKWLDSGFILMQSLMDVLTHWIQGGRVKQDSMVFWSEQVEGWNCHFLKGECCRRNRNLVINISTFRWQLDMPERYHIGSWIDGFRVQRSSIG